MNNLPILYFSLTILFSGITIYTVIQFAYTYFNMPRKETLPPLLFSCTALIYIVSDALALIFSFIIYATNWAYYFIILRELSPLLFLIIVPYFMNQVLAIKASIKRVNRILLYTVAALVILISIITIFDPSLLFKGTSSEISSNYISIINRTWEMGPLVTVKAVLMTACLLYSFIIILLSWIQTKNSYPVKYILTGLIIMSYFIFSYFYSIYFFQDQTGSGNILFPHINLSIIFFIIFMTIGMNNLFINYSTQLINMKKDLNKILYYDAVLDIPNRIGFIKDLQVELSEIKSKDDFFSLIFLDIDDFQSFNECYGESVGDEILIKLVNRLTELFSLEGNLYRIGGDEFVFLLKETKSEEDAKSLARKIVSCLRNSFSVSGVSYLITASVGVLQIPHDGEDTETILYNAYNVIRSAKKVKNTFEVFNRELLDSSSRKIHLVNILRNSIYQNQFTLYYQPVVDANEKLVYAESLLRCTHGDPSIGKPGMFIPLIEEAGLMKELDNMVIHKAFHDMEVQIRKRFSISINLSTNQLINPDYSDFLSSFANQHGIENRNIILEVTENRLMENLSSGRNTLIRLKRSGFTVAIDDFGKGFSSLNYLAEFPVDMLKIDILFVQSALENSKKEAIARHIIELAHSLNLKVIAEGFEHAEQFNFFKTQGCDLFQGYYFSRPLPLSEFIAKYIDT